MKDKQKAAAARICGFLLVWAALLLVTAAAVCGMAGNGNLLAREMLRYAPPEKTGLPESEYEGAAQMTAAYLTGREESFQYSFSDGEGRTFLCFQPHEAAHMADCRGLIRLAGTLRLAAGALVLTAAAAGMLLRRRKSFAAGMLTGLGAAGIGMTGLAAWAAADFDGFFVTFHRIAFTNEGWLLNPQTDLLIRLMPVAFFTALAARLALWVLAAALAAGTAAWMMLKWEGRFRFTGKAVNHEL